MENNKTYCVFAGHSSVASGALHTVVEAAKRFVDQHPEQNILVFDEQTGGQVELDLRGSLADVLAQLEPDTQTASEPHARGPGRPKLGVVSREVSLLPRHWQWLEEQQGGASASLRRLVETARKSGEGAQRAKKAREAASKLMWAMTGNLPNFEEATRALFAKDQPRVEMLIAHWPKDLRNQVLKMTREAARLEHLSGEAGEQQDADAGSARQPQPTK